MLDKPGTSKLAAFIEKPNMEWAGKMISAGNFFWNVGFFLFRDQEMVDAFKAHAPQPFDLIVKAIKNSS